MLAVLRCNPIIKLDRNHARKYHKSETENFKTHQFALIEKKLYGP